MRRLQLTRPKTLVHAVADRLHLAIVNGELKLGEALSEDGLAEAFGVSRTPVREALSLLQLQGLIEIAPQRGSFVFRPTVEDIERLCEFRIVLETSAAPLALARDRSNAMETLERHLAELEEAYTRGDGLAYVTADNWLHHSFFEHCGSAYFQKANALIASKTAALRTNLSAHHQTDRTMSLGEHRLIVQYFRAGDMTALSSLLRTHIDRTRNNFVEAYGSGPIPAQQPVREKYPFSIPRRPKAEP